MEKLPHGLGKPTVFLSEGGFRIKCKNSSLAPRFCVAKSNPCGILKVSSIFLQRSFQQLRTNLACGQFCKEMIELAAPAACKSVYKKNQTISRKNAFFCQIHTIIYMRPKQRRKNADRSRATKTVGAPHLYRRLHLFPGDAEKKLCLNPTTKSTRRAAPQLP